MSPLKHHEIYKMIFEVEKQKLLNKNFTLDKANRAANIFAVKYTNLAWKRQYKTMKNIFNPRGL